MSDPTLGQRVYKRRLDSLRDQFGTIMEIFQEINDKDPGPRERLALLMTGINATLQGVDDVIALERFGDVFKETGELDANILKGKDK